ncbi:MAG: TolC family protein [Gemmatimonadaceae bacterium]|nr:TolC family protein [Gemmatimonadaceae bacterium]
MKTLGAQNMVRPAPASDSAGTARHSTDLSDLVARAIATNPSLRAASRRVNAAEARASASGLLPDPMLMLGILNLPLGEEKMTAAGPIPDAGPDPMTMKMIGLSQTVPFPGKLRRERAVARHEAEAARAALNSRARQIEREVRDAYYELAFIDRALHVLSDNAGIITSTVRLTEALYGTGGAKQSEVLRARVEAGKLGGQAITLNEQRQSVLARLNALLDLPSLTPVPDPVIPARISRAASPVQAERVRFTSASLGARAADSPIPAPAELQEIALRRSPVLAEQAALIAAQAARVELARRRYLPDLDFSLQYGQRDDRPDMLTATVSLPLPWQKRRKQDALASGERSDLTALELEYRASENEIRSQVARLHAELERTRSQLALYVASILPLARASLSSATATYSAGQTPMLALLDAQATVFNHELEYFRLLTEFARSLAELEQVVGTEVLP